jgi:hypothetical protein
MQPQTSKIHMRLMTKAGDRHIQSTAIVGAQTIESEKKTVDSPSLPRPEGHPIRFTAFRDGVRGTIAQNHDRTVEARRYNEETKDFAFILR